MKISLFDVTYLQRNREIICLFCFVPPCILILWIMLSTPSQVVLIPNPISKIYAYSDTAEKGNTETRLFRNDSVVVLDYLLKKGVRYPYAGVSIYYDTYQNLSRYNRMAITFKTSNSKSVRLIVLTNEKSVTKTDVLTKRFNEITIPARKYLHRHIIDLSELATPMWWYETNGIDPGQLPSADFSKAAGIALRCDYYHDLDEPDKITVTEMRIYRNDIKLFIFSGFALFCYYIILFVLLKRKREKSIGIDMLTARDAGLAKRPPCVVPHPTLSTQKVFMQVIPYEKLNIQNSSNEELAKIVSFLACNFSDPDLSIHKTALAVNVSDYKLPAIIKEHFNSSFKEYLNMIRIEEAKRLLSQTDRRISEIAYSIGYNSLPHFNRLFKVLTGQSPREFRKSDLPD